MLYRDICKIIGNYLIGLSCALAIPFFMAVYYEFGAAPEAHLQPHSTRAFSWSILVCLILALFCRWTGKNAEGRFYRREGLIAVVLIWFLTPALAGLPYIFSGTFAHPLQAYFEAASGFTTTGATCMHAKKYDPETGQEIPIIKSTCGPVTIHYEFWGTIKPVRNPETGEIIHEGIEAVGKALLFWRSFTQWLGGGGIVVLFVAILPALGAGGKMLFQAEVPGPMKDSLTPRIKETALHLWKIYVLLSLLQVFCLMMTNREMGIYDALTVTFSTMSTGGLSPKNTSIGAFHHAATDWVVIVFMFLGSINFSLFYFLLKGKIYRFYDSEFIFFVAIVILSSSFGAWYLFGTDIVLLNGKAFHVGTVEEAYRYGAFQIISGMTTTGFATADQTLWPYPVQCLMLILMYVGGMSGSTAGGMKVVRVYMLFKIAQYKVESLFRPEAVRSFKLSDHEVSSKVAITTLVFFLVLASIAVLGTFLYIVDHVDPQTSLSLATLMINNTGMGFGLDSPTGSCAFLSDFGLVVSSLLMLFGRLEFLAVLAVMVPAFWQQD